MPRPREYTWAKAPGRHVVGFRTGQWTPSTFANFFLYEATGTSHETYTLADFPAIICGRVPNGVVNRSRCLFMEGRETTLLIIKLEHDRVVQETSLETIWHFHDDVR